MFDLKQFNHQVRKMSQLVLLMVKKKKQRVAYGCNQLIRSSWSLFSSKEHLDFLWLPGFICCPVSLPRIKGMSFRVIYVFFSLPRKVLSVLNPISLWLQQQQLHQMYIQITPIILVPSMTQLLIGGFSYLVPSMISYKMEPAMPFWWDLRSIVAILRSIFHPPVSPYN